MTTRSRLVHNGHMTLRTCSPAAGARPEAARDGRAASRRHPADRHRQRMPRVRDRVRRRLTAPSTTRREEKLPRPQTVHLRMLPPRRRTSRHGRARVARALVSRDHHTMTTIHENNRRATKTCDLVRGGSRVLARLRAALGGERRRRTSGVQQAEERFFLVLLWVLQALTSRAFTCALLHDSFRDDGSSRRRITEFVLHPEHEPVGFRLTSALCTPYDIAIESAMHHASRSTHSSLAARGRRRVGGTRPPTPRGTYPPGTSGNQPRPRDLYGFSSATPSTTVPGTTSSCAYRSPVTDVSYVNSSTSGSRGTCRSEMGRTDDTAILPEV